MTIDSLNFLNLYNTQGTGAGFSSNASPSIDSLGLFSNNWSNFNFDTSQNLFHSQFGTQTYDFNNLDFNSLLGCSFSTTSPFGNFQSANVNIGALYDNFTAELNANMQNKFLQIQQLIGAFTNWNTKPTESLKDINFDESTAKKLAQNIVAHAGSRSKSACAEYVSNAIENSGISIVRGHAYQMENNLRNNPNFKEITVSKNELASLPAGCILVYPRSSAGYSSKYGHIEVTLGNGRTGSDFINSNPKYSSSMKVFVPVIA